MANNKRLRDKWFPEGTGIRKILRNINLLVKRITKNSKQEDRSTVEESSTNVIEPKSPYLNWIENNEPTEKELIQQKNKKFKIMPKISVIVPMYNTNETFFSELVDRMLEQTYSNWELCLADGSPRKNMKLKSIYSKDKRIRYKFIGENKGIAGNTNEAINMATGDYIGLLDHDDLLQKFTLYEIAKCINTNPEVEFIYTDEDKITTLDKPRFEPHFKPDFAIDTLRSNNYICHFSVFRKDIMDKLGGERAEYDGAQDYDLIIRMAEIAKNIIHIPKVLYHWRVHELSTSKPGGDAKPYAFEAGIKVLQDHLKRVGLEGKVSHGATLGTYKIDYKVKGNPKVTILIPNYNEKDTLKKCINSIVRKTTYRNYEIAIIENNSTDKDIFEYYKELEKEKNIKILYYKEKGFNYSKIINYGVKNTDGNYIVQLNNDTELLTKDWLEKMVGMCQRDDVGAVGAELFYPDETIQHAGVIIGIGGVAGHVFKNISKGTHGYFSKDAMIQNLSAVTAACIMTSRQMYDNVNYMDEEFKVAFNDIDFCLKIRENNKLIIYNPFVQFLHYESKSRGFEDTPEKIKRFQGEIVKFQDKWKEILDKGDPYYNINLRLDNDQCAIREEKVNG